MESRLRAADEAHAGKDEELRALEGPLAAARLETEEVKRAAATERASFTQRIAALEEEKAQLTKSAATKDGVLNNASTSAWRAMETLNRALRDLRVSVPDTTHSPEDLLETVELIREGASVALRGARSFGEHCGYVGACLALSLLHTHGCRHTPALANPQLDLPSRPEVMMDAVRAIGPNLQNFHGRIWERFGEDAAKAAVWQTLNGGQDPFRWLEEVFQGHDSGTRPPEPRQG